MNPSHNVSDIKDGEKKEGVDPLDMHQLSQAFECFRHRSAFVMTALEHMAFKNERSLHHKDVAYGAGYFISDLMDELQLIQKMVDKDLKTGD
ncbi:hypothetical protein [Oceanospirillum sediminis]|uniref:Uncharacterized protein n=1 Tax=Oceanospirillum sediminis TaxID=2760088 RepID=A0A839IUR5_9GAMM|nr:hypothetical protein [Oceanospirillum sediminis]MBB1489193.1 hypothetical protein [Oceanospirillum sediminis]